MDEEIKVNGMTVASGVIATIVSMAAAEVEGVTGVGPAGTIPSTIRAVLAGKAALPAASSGVEARVVDDNKLHISVSIQVAYGQPLVEIAANGRQAVADTIASQVGVEVSAVDVDISGIVFDGKRVAS